MLEEIALRADLPLDAISSVVSSNPLLARSFAAYPRNLATLTSLAQHGMTSHYSAPIDIPTHSEVTEFNGV
jgi:hypothetical protein